MELLNNNEEQRVTVRLDKGVEREFLLRLFLDSNSKFGINRKEMILQMYQVLLDNGFIDKDQRLRSAPLQQRQAIEEVKAMNEEVYMDSIKNETQSDLDSIDPDDFSGL